MAVSAPSLKCRKCGVPLSTSGITGFCARCLLGVAMPAKSGSASPTTVLLPKVPDIRQPSPSITGKLGDYEVIGEVARGGMGVVYKAQDARTGRTVALKMILAESLGDISLKRFQSEASAAAALDHPNIVPIYEVGETGGQPFFTMKLIEGGNLSSRLTAFHQQLRKGVALLAKVARAVHHAHQRGVLHRDLKPSNILVNHEDEPFVTDFGLARRFDEQSNLTLTGTLIGTPNFIAPELLGKQGQALTTASDIFSLGGILYNVLADQPPFHSESLFELLHHVQHAEPRRPSALNPQVDRDLDTICLKCLEKDPRNRYRSALELAEDLERWLGHETIVARRATPAERAVKWARRRPVVAGLTLLCTCSLLVGVIGVFLQWRKTEAARREAVALGVSEAAARRAEQLARNNAEKAFHHTELLLTRSELDKADGLLAAGDTSGGLAYLARVLRREPANAVAAQRLIFTLRHHAFAVSKQVFMTATGTWSSGVSFSPDGQRLIVGGSIGGESYVWDVQTGKALTPALQHGGVPSAAFSHNGRWVATGGSSSSARIWDSRTGNARTPLLPSGSDFIKFLVFSSDDRRLLTWAADGTARLWDAETGALLNGTISNVMACSDDARLLLKRGTNATTLEVVDALSGLPVLPPLVHDRRPLLVRFSKNGSMVATFDSKTVSVWNLARPQDAALKWESGEPAVSQILTFSPDGRRLATTCKQRIVTLWNPETGQLTAPPLLHPDQVLFAVFSADGSRLLTAAQNHAVYVWDVASGKLVVHPLKHEGMVLTAVFGPDGHSVIVVTQDKSVKHWSLLPQRSGDLALKHEREVKAAEYSRDGRRIVTASTDGVARVWDAQTGDLSMQARHHASLLDARFSPDGVCLVTTSKDRTVKLWEIASGRLAAPPMTNQLDVLYARLAPAGDQVLVGLQSGVFQVWNASSGAALFGPLHTDEPMKLRGTRSHYGAPDFSPDGRLVIYGTSSHYARIYDMAGARPAAPDLWHPEILSTCQFSGDGRRVITASQDGTARVWDVASGSPVAHPFHHDGVVNHAALNYDGTIAISASRDSTARLWDVATGSSLTDALEHDSPVLYAEFSPDGRRALTITEDHTVRLWDVRSGKPLGDPQRPGVVNSAKFSPDGQTILMACRDGLARLWQVPEVPLPVPGWIPSFVETLGGEHIDEEGIRRPMSPENLARLRETFSSRMGNDPYSAEVRRLLYPAK